MRNAVIHSQIHLSPQAHSELSEVNRLLLDLCFELISKFNIATGEANLIQSIEKVAGHEVLNQND